jgi:voltage-gated potassium channel
MTDSAGTPRAAPSQAQPPPGHVAWVLLRAAGSTVVLVAIYYLLPLNHSARWAAIAMLTIGLAGLGTLVTFQVRWIIASPFPGLRALEALATSVPFFLLLFAGTYVALSTLSSGSFGSRLSHTDGLYFSVTVFSTVGFGDITAKSETARLVVTVQMLADLIIYGVAIKVFARAIRRGQQRKADSADHEHRE